MSIFKFIGTNTAAAKTALGVQATTAVRPAIIGFCVSNIGTVSVDSGFQIQVKRTTTAGTSTALTVGGTDPVDPTATVIGGSNFTIEPTYTANTFLYDRATNPRGQGIWQPYEQNDELRIPATASNGLGWLINALGGATTVNVEASVRQ